MDSFADATGYGGAAEIVDPEPFGKARRLHRRHPHVGGEVRVSHGCSVGGTEGDGVSFSRAVVGEVAVQLLPEEPGEDDGPVAVVLGGTEVEVTSDL